MRSVDLTAEPGRFHPLPPSLHLPQPLASHSGWSLHGNRPSRILPEKAVGKARHEPHHQHPRLCAYFAQVEMCHRPRRPYRRGGDWRQEPLGSWTEILSIF